MGTNKHELKNSRDQFLELVRAGLWPEREFNSSRVQEFKDVDWEDVYRLAEEQSVVGLIAAGIDSLGDKLNIPLELKLQIIGEALQVELQNKEMNAFVARLIEKLRKEDVYAVLVKGQGIAQCYEKPLWRASGDVDLLLSDDNYEKAKKVLIPLAEEVESEYKAFKHQGMTMKGGFVVELHGTLHSRLSKRVDKVIDEAQKSVFYGGEVRSWMNGNTTVFLPSPDNDVIFVFTHILHHFFIEGVGLRQICDWCRLLWTYREKLDKKLLEQRLKKAGIISEWRAFAALAVDWLGMPVEAMPLLNVNDDLNLNKSQKRKADRIMEFILESGNFGHNRQAASGKLHSVWLKTKDFARHARVFPLDSIKFFFHFVGNGLALANER